MPESRAPWLSWPNLALLAVALSGLAPIVLMAGRASIYADMALVKAWFTPMLVLHVNLSVGLWFLGMTAAMLGNRLVSAKISFLLAILCMAGAPLAGGEAYTSNYIPVQDNPVFFLGLGFAFASLLLVGVAGAFTSELHALTALTLLSALAAFSFSVMQYPMDMRMGEGFFEAVFWAGGHLLQLVYVQAGMLAWLMLAKKLGMRLPPASVLRGLFLALLLAAVASLGIFWVSDVQETDHILFFTRQMYWITGPVPALLALWMVWQLRHAAWKAHPALAGCLAMSLLLFLYGGVIGFLIEGSNTIIPAHYHGSTVGITLALMGVFYLFVDGGLNPQTPAATRLALLGLESRRCYVLRAAQPWLYGIGQVLHVTGLAVAGGHNIARKTAGSLSEADKAAEAALQVMRFGGALAVIGGGLFVVLAIKAILSQSVAKRASVGD